VLPHTGPDQRQPVEASRGRARPATIRHDPPGQPDPSRSKLDKRNTARYIMLGGVRGFIVRFACLRADGDRTLTTAPVEVPWVVAANPSHELAMPRKTWGSRLRQRDYGVRGSLGRE